MKTIIRWWLRVIQEYLPDAYVLAIFLTFVTLVMGIFVADQTPLQMIMHWGGGYPSLFNFAMQMVMMLLTGFIIALAPVTQRGLDWVTSKAKTPTQGVVIVGLISGIASYFNWGMGLVVGAFVARAMGAKVKGLHFPLIIATAYAGEVIRGPSSSIPLVTATANSFMAKIIGYTVPVTDTLYTWWNVVLTVGVLCLLLVAYTLVQRAVPEVIQFVEKEGNKALPVEKESKRKSFAETMEGSYWTNAVFGILPLVYVIMTFYKKGFDLNLNIVITVFLTIGIFLHKSPNTYLAAIKEAVVATRGIIIQFPIYAGMMGMMKGSGLVEIMSNWFVSMSTPETFPLWTFLSAGLVNIFIPSGGGQWAVQGPIMVKAAIKMGADLPKTIMAFCWGDSWTNQIQPFWALPLLGVAGLSARDIMGYCFVFFLLAGLFISGMFMLLMLI
ncbi:MAG: short-chain fatty acid transporter [Deltaproteobacteria bacterium]|nr:short-chain fatty acid transporter [Deltaproteobacteria bacterium]